MGLLKEFREFALRGNVIDLAVGVIIGASFGLITKSMVDDIIMPPIGKAIGKPELQYRQITYDQFRGILLQMRSSQSIADLFVEMSEALNSGYVRALEPRSQRNTTPISPC